VSVHYDEHTLHVLPRYRRSTRWDPENDRYETIAIRDVAGANGQAAEHRMLWRAGVLCDLESGAHYPGQRSFTAAEYVGPKLHRRKRWGESLVVLREYTNADAAFKQWCVARCDDELSDGYRFRPETWSRVCRDELDIVFLPEFDDPRPAVRALALFERDRRAFSILAQEAEARRNDNLRRAAAVGLTRRQAAAMLGLSLGRVQALIANDSR
jgi:hypothetical protein